jgi:hypothetical protein
MVTANILFYAVTFFSAILSRSMGQNKGEYGHLETTKIEGSVFADCCSVSRSIRGARNVFLGQKIKE